MREHAAGTHCRAVAGRARAAAALAAGALLAAACSGTAAGPAPGTRPGAEAGTAPPAPGGAPLIPEPSALPTVSAEELLERDMADLAAQAERLAGQLVVQRRPAPIEVAAGTTRWDLGATYRGTFADPDIVRHGDAWFAYGTNTSHNNLPVLASRDLTRWAPVGDALPTVGGWVTDRRRGHGLWAPSVEPMGGGWTATYSAKAGTSGGKRHNCIGLARGDSPTGPFRPTGDPICYGVAELGVIDPDLFVDEDRTPWLLWKFSGVVGQRPAGIFIRELRRDGTGFADGSETVELLTLEHAWESPTIENPSMVQFRGFTYLFYSGSSWEDASYATGYALCVGPTGPCARPGDGSPLLTTATTGHAGPGGAAAFVHDGALRLLYHAWDPGRVGSLRRLHVAGLWQRSDGTLEIVHPG